MKMSNRDAMPLIVIAISLSLALFLPTISENEVIRVGWAIIHAIFAVGYIVGISIINEIHSLRRTTEVE